MKEKVLIYISCLLIISCVGSSKQSKINLNSETKKVNLLNGSFQDIAKKGFQSSVEMIVGGVPLNLGLNFISALINRPILDQIFPQPDVMGAIKGLETKLNEIQQTLTKINQTTETILHLQVATINTLNAFYQQYNQNEVYKQYMDLYQIINQVDSLSNNLYNHNIFPITNNDFWAYANSICPHEKCSDKDASIIVALGGNLPNIHLRNNVLTGFSTGVFATQQELFQKIYNNLQSWQQYNQLINAFLYSDAIMANEQKLSVYYNVLNQIISLQAGYFASLNKLYNFQLLQVAMRKAHPKLFINTPFPINMQGGSDLDGFNQTKILLDDLYLKANNELTNIFVKTDQKTALIQLPTPDNYINYVLSGGDNIHQYVESLVYNKCTITKLKMNTQVSGEQNRLGSMNYTCGDNSKEYQVIMPFKLRVNKVFLEQDSKISYVDPVHSGTQFESYLQYTTKFSNWQLYEQSMRQGLKLSSWLVAFASKALNDNHGFSDTIKIGQKYYFPRVTLIGNPQISLVNTSDASLPRSNPDLYQPGFNFKVNFPYYSTETIKEYRDDYSVSEFFGHLAAGNKSFLYLTSNGHWFTQKLFFPRLGSYISLQSYTYGFARLIMLTQYQALNFLKDGQYYLGLTIRPTISSLACLKGDSSCTTDGTTISWSDGTKIIQKVTSQVGPRQDLPGVQIQYEGIDLGFDVKM